VVFASAYIARGYQSFFLTDSVRKRVWLVNAIMGSLAGKGIGGRAGMVYEAEESYAVLLDLIDITILIEGRKRGACFRPTGDYTPVRIIEISLSYMRGSIGPG